MPSTATARQLGLPTADEIADSAATRAALDFVNSRALEILREWASAPEIQEIIARPALETLGQEAATVTGADARRQRA